MNKFLKYPFLLYLCVLILTLNISPPFFVGNYVSTTNAELTPEQPTDYNPYLGDGMWDDLVIPASLINPSGSAAPPSIDDADGTLLFSNTADNTVAIIFQLPHSWKEGTDVSFHIHWAKTTSAAGNVNWQVKYKWCNIGATFDAYTVLYSGVVSVPDSNIAERQALQSFPTATGLISGSGKKISSILNVWLQRTTGGTDTYGAPTRLISADLHIQKDGNGSRQMLIK